MELVLKGGQLSIREPFDFSRFKLVVLDPVGVDAAKAALSGVASLADESTAWVSMEAMRGWQSLRDDPRWLSGIEVMAQKAAQHGWLRQRDGAVRAHVEWAQSEIIMPLPDSDLSGDFRMAMRRLAATVSIVTTSDEGVCHGMTATAVSSLTTTPPALLVCVNRAASIHDHIVKVRRFCINLLGPHHQDLCPVFSGTMKGSERFRHGEWRVSKGGLPYLANAQASIFCDLDGHTSYGTHSIFVGRVRDVELEEMVDPLLYQNGELGRFNAAAS